MNSQLSFNEVLLIAGHAFEPYQCVAWTPADGTGSLSLTVIDRTTRPLGRTQLSCNSYSDPVQLASILEKSRDELRQQGYDLKPWAMPQ